MIGGLMTDTDRLISNLWLRCIGAFAPDEIDEEFKSRIKAHINLVVREVEMVQCVGMKQPVPLLELYQPTRLKEGTTTVSGLVKGYKNAVIRAGPGQGKTTLLSYILLSEGSQSGVVPLFFSLRTEGHFELLSQVALMLDRRRKLNWVPPKSDPLILLVDGYDEITEVQQKEVSAILVKYVGARAGSFLLACRTAYTVYNLNCPQYELAEFSSEDAIRVTDAFARAMDITKVLDGSKLVKELTERKLSYIASHPLMLMLACVVKSSTNPHLPHNAIELLRQAMETLAFRWDEGRGVRRNPAETGLRSINMIECSMRIAHEMTGLRVARGEVLAIIMKYLKLLRYGSVFPEKVLDDIKRFFGFIESTPDGYCQFVHKTIHDYLGARFIVENGLFQPGRVEKWDMLAAYAASLLHDATFAMHTAFIHSKSVEAVRECLLNGARFDADQVANAVFSHFDSFHNYSYTPPLAGSQSKTITISSESDFFDVADAAFLEAICRKAPLVGVTNGVRVVLAFCISEYQKRKLEFPETSFKFAIRCFGAPDAMLAVWRSKDLDEIALDSLSRRVLSN
jgi:hypothetical protein